MTTSDFSRLCVHTLTTRPWSLAQCIDGYQAAGIPAMSVWRNVIDPNEGGVGIEEAARLVRASGLQIPALVRGGFFPAMEGMERKKAIDHNRQCIEEASALEAEMLVLVVGAVPRMPLIEARKQARDGIEALLPYAESWGVKLAIEPLHPMYAADKSCINRLREAREICEILRHPSVGIAVDVYHVWFDPELENEIRLAGTQGTLFGYHICDWRVDTRNLLNDRGLMGDGCIDLRAIRSAIQAVGFSGFYEVEVFSDDYWTWNQEEYLELIKKRYLESS